MRITHVVGARPNFMKIAPIMRALDAHSGVSQTLIHTGQHYDAALSSRLFGDLEIPAPDLNLGIGSGPAAAQMGRMLVSLAAVFEEVGPDLVVTVGDVTSTLAGALAASQLGLRVAHVEAGLRSGDRSMPEELNRTLTDRLSDFLFATERDALRNLERENIDLNRVHLVGNVMIDSLDRHLPAARALGVPTAHGLAPASYLLVTLHRPGNVDKAERLDAWLRALADVSARSGLRLVFPMHPRTGDRVKRFGLAHLLDGMVILEPLGYLEFIGLMHDAAGIVTDSGGIQEEATVVGVPCVTVRPSTERPITVKEGSNTLFTAPPADLADTVLKSLAAPTAPHRPEGWDGNAAERIVDVIVGSVPQSVLDPPSLDATKTA